MPGCKQGPLPDPQDRTVMITSSTPFVMIFACGFIMGVIVTVWIKNKFTKDSKEE